LASLKFLLIASLALISFRCIAQKSFSEEYKFAEYLINSREYEDAIAVLSYFDADDLSSVSSKDSLNYLIGWGYYNWEKMEPSAKYLELVGESSALYPKSRCYLAYNYVEFQDLTAAATILESLKVPYDIILKHNVPYVSFMCRVSPGNFRLSWCDIC